MGLRDIEATLPPGFRFYPSDEELVCHYLYSKIANGEAMKGTLVEIDLHTCEPWQLPEEAKLNANEWYFFSFRDRKYATGFRTNRATTSGYWKATGKDRPVHDLTTREIVGMRKTLVFYRSRAPNGIKSGWIMHEFRLETPSMPPKEDWVLCRVFHKSKEPEDNKLSPSTEHMFQSVPGSVLPSQAMDNYGCALSSSLAQYQTFPCGPYHQSSTALSLRQDYKNDNSSALFNLEAPAKGRRVDCSSSGMSTRPAEDGYGYFWDTNLEDNYLRDDPGMGSNLEGVGFELGNNGLAFPLV